MVKRAHRGGHPPQQLLSDGHLGTIATGAMPMRVSLADKVHNARAILWDHRKEGEKVWDRFSGTKEDTLSYYRRLVKAYRAGGMTGFPIDEFDRVVGKLEKRAAESVDERDGAKPSTRTV